MCPVGWSWLESTQQCGWSVTGHACPPGQMPMGPNGECDVPLDAWAQEVLGQAGAYLANPISDCDLIQTLFWSVAMAGVSLGVLASAPVAVTLAGVAVTSGSTAAAIFGALDALAGAYQIFNCTS